MTSLSITPELLARHDRPGPRYTSYPTAVEFSEAFGPGDYEVQLRAASQAVSEPLSLYVHLPFCDARCSFCGCHVVVARRPEVAEVYLDRVVAEADRVAGLLGERRTLGQYHLGGGTPTSYRPERLRELHVALTDRFDLSADCEVAIEVDPRVTTADHLDALRCLGFNRLSMGVQDADETVQELIGRGQTWEQSLVTFEQARRLAFTSINIDLIYGLPGQTPDSFADTLDRVVALRPDRVAAYSFAYVPWIRPHQKRLDTATLPDREVKFALLALAVETLTGAGYRQIGMDHFALPGDELAVASELGTLSRNFMGYTVRNVGDVVALGTSGISDVQGAYVQNHKRLASYYGSVDAGELPVERGIRLSGDDLIRRHVITELMCNSRIRFDEVDERFGIDSRSYFASELEELAGPGSELAVVEEEELRATELGRPFIRNVAMTFDAYLGATRDRPVFSRTV
ncbi:MAG: oxygen-independent coproporphyrinogen III oxidase [Actinobacteria bacterium]|nr:MAG: oxygen-independent coproporphyrinogen III oxidase [Actinomycetota bacterium]RIK05791.1 MAG: oxygen-independent coproporphyrinogen III oxidase [Acidobacteriota bacterium]